MVIESKKNVYFSCGCAWCRNVPSKIKGAHKKWAHRMFRRKAKAMLRRGDDSTPLVSSGYVY